MKIAMESQRSMHKIKLLPYQLAYIRRVAEGCMGDLEGYLCDKYQVACIEQLNATDCEDIEEHMSDFFKQGN